MLGDTVITLAGKVTTDPKLRTTRSGTPFCNFTLAAPRSRRDPGTGEWQPDTPLLLRCSLWRAQAENFAASVRAGDRVLAHGRLRLRTFLTDDGVGRVALELEVLECGPSLLDATAVPAPVDTPNQARVDDEPLPDCL